MKKINVVLLSSLLLCGCSESEYVHSSEPRSQVYYGQPVADVYENFGAPSKGIRLSDNERILIWISQEIEKDWAYRYLRACTVKIQLRNERVVNWSAEGQGCVISSNSDGEEIDQLIASKQLPDTPSYSLPADAFGNGVSSDYMPSVLPTGQQRSTLTTISAGTQSVGTSLPSDAFESGLFSAGTAPAYYTPAPQQPTAPRVIQQAPVKEESSWFSFDDSDDEWGLFDS